MLSISNNGPTTPCSAYSAAQLPEPVAKRRRLNCENQAHCNANAQWMNAISLKDRSPPNVSSLNESHGQFTGGNNQYGNATISDNGQAIIGNQYQTHNHFYGRSPSNAELATSADRLKQLVDSLTFRRMDARLHNIATALPKTCTWLFRHPAFKQWTDDDDTKKHGGFLWIKGKPGCGKSTIIKGALGWANKNRMKRGWITISYFFNARAPGVLEKSTLGLYRHLVHQILQVAPQFRSTFEEMFAGKAVLDEISWTITELQEFFVTIVSSTDRPCLCIFIDALDEGDEQDIRALLSFLENLTARIESGPLLRICLSSRHYPHITIKRGLSLIVEKQRDHDRDIELYVENKLTCIDETVNNELLSTVCTRSSGIFLWVVLVVPILNQFHDQGKTVTDLLGYLARLPKDLEGLFAEILAREADEVRDCVSLLQWVLYAFMPLSPEQLYLAIQHSWARPDEDVIEVPSEQVLSRFLLHSSRGLVEVTRSHPPVIQFIHETVREFLVGASGLAHVDVALRSNLHGWSHAKLAQVCLSYISRSRAQLLQAHPDILQEVNRSEIGLRTQASQSWPFLPYAVENILKHAEEAQQTGIAQSGLLELLTSENYQVDALWRAFYNTFEKYRVRRYSADTTILYVTADLQLPTLTALLAVQSDLDLVNRKCMSRYATALQAACHGGNQSIVRSLLDAGADANVMGGEHKYAIVAAFQAKHYTICRHLLVAIANFDARTFVKLFGAHTGNSSSEGHAILDSLARKVTNFSKIALKQALRTASAGGHEKVVQTLLDKGADVNAQGGTIGTALYWASYGGHEKVVRMLLDKGADVNAQGGDYGTALQAASVAISVAISVRGPEKVVQMLLDKGADVNAQGGHYGTALQAASVGGQEKVVRMLLDKGADVNAQGGCFGTALQAASAVEHEKVVQMLVDAGADVNAQGGRFGTALQAASERGHEKAEEIL